jgi:hypothetical protein
MVLLMVFSPVMMAHFWPVPSFRSPGGQGMPLDFFVYIV